MARFKRCSKCGRGHTVIGPHYEKDGRGERLRYRCICGHTFTEPTKDSPRDYGCYKPMRFR